MSEKNTNDFINNVEEIRVNDVPTKQYLYDQNQLLFEIKQLLKYQIQNQSKPPEITQTTSKIDDVPVTKNVNVMGRSLE